MKIKAFDILFVLIVVVIISAFVVQIIYIRNNNYSTIIIDNCQYIRTWSGHGWTVTHKGDCTNAIHLKNK